MGKITSVAWKRLLLVTNQRICFSIFQLIVLFFQHTTLLFWFTVTQRRFQMQQAVVFNQKASNISNCLNQSRQS